LAVDVEERRMRLHGRAAAEGLAGDEPPTRTVGLEQRQLVRRMVRERGLGLLGFVWQRHPNLHAVEAAALAARALEALRMRDAAPGRHEVHLARADRLLRADAVAVHDLAREKIR